MSRHHRILTTLLNALRPTAADFASAAAAHDDSWLLRVQATRRGVRR